jgi:hypothetical protein
MKKVIGSLVLLGSVFALGISGVMANKISNDCTYNGIKLYGKVKIVERFPDIKVQKKDAFQDLSVQYVKAFPDACGKWQVVDTFPDFTVQFVDRFPDITIREVTAFPGIK